MPRASSSKSTPSPARKAGAALSLRDLAQMAGVDVSTASRSLRGDPRISRERAESVRKLAAKVGYRPRPLRGKRTHAIALLLPTGQSDNPYLQRLLWMVEHAATERGLHMNLEFVSPGEEEAVLPAIVAQNRVDGVLLAGYPPVRLKELIQEAGLPMVAFNESFERLGVPCVQSHPANIYRETITRLAAWGHRRIGLALTQRKFATMEARYREWIAAMSYVDIEAAPSLILDGLPDNLSGGREAIEQFAARGELPTAILFGNDWMALGAMHELTQRGLQVPRDVSIVGSGDYPICATAKPALTTFGIDELEFGRAGLQLLMDQIEQRGGSETRELLLPQHVVWRDSTGPQRPVVSPK